MTNAAAITPPEARTVTLHNPARRASTAITLWAVAALAGLALTSGTAWADDCPNATLRTQNHSANLPDCRAYELVTSPFKEGFAPVNAPTYTDNDAAAYYSSGNFAGNGMGSPFNQYVAKRSATGWMTTSLNPSGPGWAVNINNGAEALSADLGSSLWLMRRPDESTDIEYYYLRGPDGTFTRIGPAMNPATVLPGSPGTAGPVRGPAPSPGVSQDLSHVVFKIEPALAFPGDQSVGDSLYEYVGTGNARPRLVGLDNTGNLVSTAGTCPNGMSTDGRVIFFLPGCGGSVWARINGTTSINMSADQCTRTAADPDGACTGADDASLVGAADDGSRAFFTTSKQLIDGDTNQTTDLYACDIPMGTPVPVGVFNRCAALTRISGTATDANVQSVLRVSADGSTVYFVAQGVLATNQGTNDAAAVAGDNNLYVWQENAAHPVGKTTFIAKLDDSIFSSYTATTDNGRYFAFLTSTALVNSGPGIDNHTAADVYRYDAEINTVTRVSTATSGEGGNDPSANVIFRGPAAMSADGGTMVFETSESLSPLDSDVASDVYEWHDGEVSQISSGGAEESAITASGKSIFFKTSEPLTAADSDTNFDLYDARVGGGFDFTRAAACLGEECRGNRSAPPDLAAPSATPPEGGAGDVQPSFALRAVTAAQRKQLAATGRVVLTVTTNTPAALTATATATIAKRSVGIGSARHVMAASGSAKLTLRLSKTARAQLTGRGKLTVKIVVRDSKVALARSTTLKLTHSRSRRSSAKRADVTSERSRS